MNIDTSQIKNLGTPKMHRNQVDGGLDIISPVELMSGEYSPYIQGIDIEVFTYMPEEFAGPFKTEEEALASGFRYLDQWEAELKVAVAA